MISIERNFNKIQAHNQNYGSYLCLAEAIKGKKYSRKSLVRNFIKLMPQNEYLKSEQKGLIDYLENLTNLSEEGEKEYKNALKRN